MSLARRPHVPLHSKSSSLELPSAPNTLMPLSHGLSLFMCSCRTSNPFQSRVSLPSVHFKCSSRIRTYNDVFLRMLSSVVKEAFARRTCPAVHVLVSHRLGRGLTLKFWLPWYRPDYE
ncbi:unnamed protein product [Jaminaea pallidilutea]